MLKSLLRTDASVSSLILRLTLGAVMFPHGAQKALGWFGGNGFAGTMDFFTQHMGIPWIFALLAICAEFFGSLGLITGFLTRLAALGVGTNMVVAVVLVHARYGFLMNWHGTKPGEGFEYHLLAIGIAAALVIRGGGLWSADRALAGEKRPKPCSEASPKTVLQ